MKEFNVSLTIDNKKYNFKAEENKNLLRLLQENGINISSPCGGDKTCGKCKVTVSQGGGSITASERELLSEDDIQDNYRLACCIDIRDNIDLKLAQEGQLQIMTGGNNIKLNFDPSLRSYPLKKEDIAKDISYLRGMASNIKANRITLDSLQETANIIEKDDLYILELGDEIVSVKDKPFTNLFGLAVDIGTTTVAVYLMDLLSGEERGVFSFHNPQKKFGADVISRINYTLKNVGSLKEMQEEIVTGINQAIRELVIMNNLNSDDIYQLTIVGNTIMLHFLLGINAASIARTPYTPVFTDSLEVSPDEINIEINKSGRVQILPSVSGYIGADIIADLLIADFKSNKWKLLLDLGTNGEIVLGNKQKILACSAAAGPAFEGANITFGTAGVPGAISKFTMDDNGRVGINTIDSETPIGICGSGLVDIIAGLIEHDLLKSTGAFKIENNEEYFTDYKDMQSFRVLAGEEAKNQKPILLTQKDVREVQLAKGAISAGVNILLKEAGIGFDDIDTVYLAGGFGSFIDSASACKIGLLPGTVEDRIVRIGNGAGTGAKAYLVNRKMKEEVKALLEKIEYIELSLRKDFQDEFMNSMEF